MKERDMTVTNQFRDFVEAQTFIAEINPALVLQFVGVDAAGWANWSIRKGGCVEPIGSMQEAPDGTMVVRLHSELA